MTDFADPENTIEFEYHGETVLDSCYEFEILPDDVFLSMDVYFNIYITGLRLTFTNGKRVRLGNKQSLDDTVTWDFENENFQPIGLKGTTDEDRLVSLQLIVYDEECGVENYIDPESGTQPQTSD